MNLNFLTGRTTDQLIPFRNSKFLVHRAVAHNLGRLFDSAAKDVIEFSITSSFRSYDDQVKIWNNKAQGLRPVLNSDSIPLDLTSMSKDEILFAILRWSAMPGASRHHWGTDLDVFDQKKISSNYKVQLIPSEYEENGPFYNAHLWLLENMKDFGFYRPYSKDTGGIAPEPWHLSYQELSQDFMEKFSFLVFEKHLQQSDFLLLAEAQNHAAEIYPRFIQLHK